MNTNHTNLDIRVATLENNLKNMGIATIEAQVSVLETNLKNISKSIFEYLQNNLTKYYYKDILYEDGSIKNDAFGLKGVNEIYKKDLFSLVNNIFDENVSGVYLIAEEYKPVYIGKHNTLNTRLKQHLVSETATGNKFKKVKQSIEEGKELSIAVYPVKSTFAIEGAVITEYEKYLKWNDRVG